MFTAAAVLEMGSAGALVLDEPVQRTSAVLTRRLAQLTLHQLLSHTSGLRDMPGSYGELGDEGTAVPAHLAAKDRILAPDLTFPTRTSDIRWRDSRRPKRRT